MGSWTLTISGHGIHDNGRPDDVDQMVMEFVRDLRTGGQVIDAAHLTVGAGRAVTTDSPDPREQSYRTF